MQCRRSRTAALQLLALGLLALASSSRAQFTLDREPVGPSSRMTGFVITEILYHPRLLPGLATNQTLDFVEIYNSKPWPEDIGGFTLRSLPEDFLADGIISFRIPTNTIVPAKSHLVIGRWPALLEAHYGITGVFGWSNAVSTRLSRERGTLQLLNRQDAVVLTIQYQDSPPWPEAADGTGHSLSLVRPSFGEDDSRAWAQSDTVGGSPGGPEPRTLDPLAPVVINEWQNHSDPEDWIELYNHSNGAVDLSGAWLSDDPFTNKFRIPNGTLIPARGFLGWSQNQLGFELFAGGESIFFWNSNQTRVLDVIDFRGQSNNMSSGRSPDGGPNLYGLATPTRGGPNARPQRYGVVINELMYNPVSGSNIHEYVEIHNRGSQAVSLAGWEFVVGIRYTFPTNAITQNMPPGAHWVVGKSLTNLMLLYTNLSTNVNLFGPYDGSLADGGERIVLAAADYDRVANPGGGEVEVRLNVPVSDFTYGDGGWWGNWADGRGSSLELIDPEADVKHPSSWADSNDTGESLWTAIEYNGPLAESLGSPANDHLILGLQGIGECLLDEIEVRVDGGPNLVANGGFESGLSGWTLQGSHDFSTLENEGFAGSQSLHVRAASRGDHQSNRILSAPLASPIPPDARNVSIRAKARWHRGMPEVLLRLHGSATEAYGRLHLPQRLGTPGERNSRRIPNAGPAVYQVKHAPILPAAGEPVVVSAIAIDGQPVSTLTLRYRLDPSPNHLSVAMRDDGTGGDAIAADGVFSGTIPGQAAGVMAPFHVEARDTLGGIGTFPQQVFPEPGFDRCWPVDALTRECLVRWGEVQMPGDFATYHLWVSAVNSNRWHTRGPMNNTEMDGTFIYNNVRIIYNSIPLFSGSPWHRTNSTTGPAGVLRVDYEMNFRDDDPLLGATEFILNNPGNPDQLTVSDLSALEEQTVYRIFEGMGLIHNHRRYIHFFVNGSQRSRAYERAGNFIFEDSQQPNGDMIGQWFSGDPPGQLFKVEDWFEFDRNGFDVTAFNDADLVRRTTLLHGTPTLLPGPYRYMFRIRSLVPGRSLNDFQPIYDVIDAVSPAQNPDAPTVDPDLLAESVDWEAWMRHFAVQRALGNYDTWGWDRGKNDYLYQTASGFVHMPWDIDYGLGLGRPANAALFGVSDPRLGAMYDTPAITRAYWRSFLELVAGPFRNEYLDPFIDGNRDALLANLVDIDLGAVEAIKAYIANRHSYIQAELVAVQRPFAVDFSSVTTDNNLLFITGTAPVEAKFIALNGVIYPVTWTGPNTFQMRVVLQPGLNQFQLQGVSRLGGALTQHVATASATFTGMTPDPAGALVLTEIQYRPALSNAHFIEIQNRSIQSFDLAGWQLGGAGLTFPVGSVITNGETVVVVRDRRAFAAVHGSIPVFAVFPTSLPTNQQTVFLSRPDGSGGWSVVDAVGYESSAPWPLLAPGQSLQLIDPARDNARVVNWAVDPSLGATPRSTNSVSGTLPPFDPLWLNEVQLSSLVGPNDNMGDSDPWLELLNSGPTPLSLDGYYLADNVTSNLTRWPFPSGFVLQPGEARLLWLDGEPAESSGNHLHTDFRLAPCGPLSLTRLLQGVPQITDYLKPPRLGANVSYGSHPDGQPAFRSHLRPATPLQTNSAPPVPLLINEWMARNNGVHRDPADGRAEDWFEIYNAGRNDIDLGGYHLTDSTFAPTRFQVPANGRYTIPAGGFLLVWADATPAQNSPGQADLHVNFQLSGSVGEIALFAPDGVTPVDGIVYGDQIDNVSEGRYADGAGYRISMPRSTPRAPNAHPTYNSPPTLPLLGDIPVARGSTNIVNIRAADPDGSPPQTLFYTIESGPPGLQVSQAGQVRWVVPTNQPLGRYPAAVRVADNGTPTGVDQLRFDFVVRVSGATNDVPPVIYTISAPPGQVTFSIETTPLRTYRVEYLDDLGTGIWSQLGRDFVAANASASLTDTLVLPRRFYRVQLLPVCPCPR